MNPVAVRPAREGRRIVGVRVLGPMHCRGCGQLVHLVRRWYGLHLVDLDGLPGSKHQCIPVGPGHAWGEGHDWYGCAPCHRLTDEQAQRQLEWAMGQLKAARRE